MLLSKVLHIHATNYCLFRDLESRPKRDVSEERLLASLSTQPPIGSHLCLGVYLRVVLQAEELESLNRVVAALWLGSPVRLQVS